MEAEQALKKVLDTHSYEHFKIGKTTQTLDQRFAENYEGQYSDIALLYDSGTDGELMDWLEEEMIKRCLKTYGEGICDNRQEGGGPTCKDNATKENTAKLYVVWK